MWVDNGGQRACCPPPPHPPPSKFIGGGVTPPPHPPVPRVQLLTLISYLELCTKWPASLKQNPSIHAGPGEGGWDCNESMFSDFDLENEIAMCGRLNAWGCIVVKKGRGAL